MSDEIWWEMALNGKKMDDNFRSPCIIGDEACLHGFAECADASYLSLPYWGGYLYIFFHAFYSLVWSEKSLKWKKPEWQKKFNFFNFLRYLLHISKNLYLIAHRVLCVTEYIPLGKGFKARYNRTIFVVFTDFWIFILGKIHDVEKNILYF